MSISLAQVKIELGLVSNATYDAQITAEIPKAEAKYRTISGNAYLFEMFATFTNTELTFKVGGLDYAVKYGDAFLNTYPTENSEIFEMKFGDIIEGTGIPADTYITGIDKIDNEVTVNNAFTADGDRLTITTNIEYYATISAMIWYQIGKQSTTAQDLKEISAKSVGPLSVTFSNADINLQYGYPSKIIDAIPKFVGLG